MIVSLWNMAVLSVGTGKEEAISIGGYRYRTPVKKWRPFFPWKDGASVVRNERAIGLDEF